MAADGGRIGGAEVGVTKVQPVADRFSMDDVINGIASDLADLRSGTITVEQARVRAELAKQYLAGVRLVFTAQKFLQEQAKLIAPDEKPEGEGSDA